MSPFFYIFLAMAIAIVYYVIQKKKEIPPIGSESKTKEFKDDVTYHLPKEININIFIKKDEN